MNRIAKLVCWLVIGEMTLAGLIAISARWAGITHHPGAMSFLDWRLLFAIVFFPAWAAFGVYRTDLRLRPKAMVLSPSYRRFSEVGMVVACLLITFMDHWFAVIFALKQEHWDVSPQQVGMLIGGAAIMVIGNASAKLAPPTGPGAPDPGDWIRTSLRNGWAVVAIGMIMIIAAFMPVGWRVAATLAILPIMLATVYSQRRLLRGEPGPTARLT